MHFGALMADMPGMRALCGESLAIIAARSQEVVQVANLALIFTHGDALLSHVCVTVRTNGI